MSANTGILTYNNGIYQTSSVYYSPTAIIPVTGKPVGTIYCFLSKVEPWTNDNVPPIPAQDQKYLKQVFKNMFVAKKITTNDITPIIQRVDWVTGTVYDHYRDDIDMFELNESGIMIKRFYIKNRFDQVFKCLSNNKGGSSTKEPYFEPGTFNSNSIYQGTDNYKWKYMYTITSGLKEKFMDSSWMPVPYTSTTVNPGATFAGAGDIEVINVTQGGSNYDPSLAAITVNITGDGLYATGNVVVSGGAITDITIANTGSNYTYANVSIVSTVGSGATAITYTSPIGGHSFNPMAELGVRHVMLSARFNKDESGNLPTDIDFRQVGLLVNPYARFGTIMDRANAEIYKTTTDFVVSTGFGAYTPDETVFESATTGLLADATFTATVLSFDSTTNKVKLINTQGTATNSTVLYGKTSGTARVVLQQQQTDFIPYSGYLTYLENRSAVQRSSDGSEQFKLVLGY